MVVFFDVDDTLYNLMTSFQRVHEELFAHRINASCEALFLASRKYNKEAFDLWNKGLLSKTEEFHYRIRKSYEEYGLSLTENELNEFRIRYRKYQDEISIDPNMISLLDRLKRQQVTLGVITNGNHDDQWKKIKALKIENWIPTDHIFVSEDLPAPKPEAAAFHYVEEKLGLDPLKEDIWYVGDTFDADVVGAQSAGWKSIWLNHRKKLLPAGAIPATIEISEPWKNPVWPF